MNIFEKIKHRPVIVGSIGRSRNPVLEAGQAARDGADLVEVRLDLLLKPGLRIEALLKKMKKESRRPLIATVRRAEEQGKTQGPLRLSEEQRKLIFREALPFSDFVDVELKSPIAKEIVRKAQKAGKGTILSCHDFRGVPSQIEIKKILKNFRALRGDVLKVACAPRSRSELANFMSLCCGLKDIIRVFIAMGDLGRISRLAGFVFGSCMTYGYVKKGVAPGQLSVKELANGCNFFYPKRLA